MPKPGRTGIFAALSVAAALLLGWYLPRGWNVLGLAVCLTFFLGAIGKLICGRTLGALINERNLVSLSRFQMALWTVLVLSAYLGYAIVRMREHAADPLNVAIDWRLWALMGVSTTSLIASPLILGAKKDKQPNSIDLESTSREAGEDVRDIDFNRDGTLYVNNSIADARFTDLFQGDEVGNTMRIDLAKVQMFYFTIIAALAFLVAVISNLASATPDLSHLPQLADGLVAVLGISHAGYLTGKSLDHTARP